MNREFSAGGAVYKKDGEQVLWLIRRSKPSALYPEENRWTWPRGWIEKGESVEEAALREVREEGWVEAKIIRKIMDQRLVYTPRDVGEKVFKVITYFLMEFVRNSSKETDQETAEAVWLPYEEARKKLIFSSEKRVLDLANKMLIEGQANLF